MSKDAGARDDRMPAGVPYIVSNEFAERFCFYGINSILTIYLVQFMHFTDAKGAAPAGDDKAAGDKPAAGAKKGGKKKK
jgi:hypothetical protein